MYLSTTFFIQRFLTYFIFKIKNAFLTFFILGVNSFYVYGCTYVTFKDLSRA